MKNNDSTPTDSNPRTPVSPPPAATNTTPITPNAPPVERPPQSKSHRAGRTVSTILLVSLFGLVAGVGGAVAYEALRGDSAATFMTGSGDDGSKIVTKEEEDIASVVTKVSPSVVSIVTQTEKNSYYYGTTTAQGAGTGIVVSSNGHIMTNKHVIDGAETVSVVLADGTTYDDVKVLGTDPLNDIAFLKIANVDNLPVAELGDSTSVRVGQKVIAIGNSLGQYQNTVTSGIISGTGRPVSAKAGDSVETLTDLIQTDAAINPGNSGGPLLNLQGQVIGINTAIAADAQGIGFAIPIGATKGILESVLAGNGVRRAYLGISYVPITADTAAYFGLSVKKGAYVYSSSDSTSAVKSDSPADKAGIKNKDIITKVGDVEVGDRGSVASLIASHAPGETVTLTVLRDGKTRTIEVTLAAYNR